MVESSHGSKTKKIIKKTKSKTLKQPTKFSKLHLASFVFAGILAAMFGGYLLFASSATIQKPVYPSPALTKLTESSNFYGVNVPAVLIPDLRGASNDAGAQQITNSMSQTGAKWMRTSVNTSLYYSKFQNIQCGQTLCDKDKLPGYEILGVFDQLTMESAPLLCEGLSYAPQSNPNFTLADWEKTVDCYSKKFKGIVKAYEIWNEPTVSYFMTGYQNGTANNYFNMLKSAQRIIKTNDPTATIVGLGGLSLYSGADSTALNKDFAFANQLSVLGAINYMDAISLHAYPWGSPSNAVWDAYGNSLNYYKTLFPSKPLWVTETGQNIDQSDQSYYLYRAYGLFINQGVNKIFWYTLKDKQATLDGIGFGFFDTANNPRDVLGYHWNYVKTPKSGLLRVETAPSAQVKVSLLPADVLSLTTKTTPFTREWSVDWERLQAGDYSYSFSYPYSSVNGQPVVMPKVSKGSKIQIKAGMTLVMKIDITRGTIDSKYYWE